MRSNQNFSTNQEFLFFYLIAIDLILISSAFCKTILSLIETNESSTYYVFSKNVLLQFVVCALVASALADVSLLFSNKPKYTFPNPKPYRVATVSRPILAPIPARTSPTFIPPVPLTGLNQVAILRQDQNIEPDGSYSYRQA